MSGEVAPKTIEDLGRWLAAKRGSVWHLLGERGGAELAVAFSSLFWPEFVEVEGCVVLRDRYDPLQFERWRMKLGGECRRIEGVVNHIHLWDLLNLENSELPEQATRDLATILAATWRCALQERFPRKRFDVRLVLDDPDEYGPTISFFSND